MIFEKLTQKLIIFETFFVGKVPKSSVFNRECLENSEKLKLKKSWKSKKGQIKNRVFAASRKLCSGQIK